MSERNQEENQDGRLICLETGIGGMPFGRDEVLNEVDAERKREALRYFQLAYEAQMRKELDQAAELYKSSIETYP
ncbi:MAG TPA: hypothetical protein VFV34_11790, partial [Blastocatellia bacterium]|nr:hypothetical protein [Blastocatellia bacterium]